MNLKLKAQTAIDLGFLNLARVFAYRLGVKTGINPVKKLICKLSEGPFFGEYKGTNVGFPVNSQWLNNHCYFGKSRKNNDTPNWHQSCLNGKVSRNELPWYAISDFDNGVGDIKGVWEASRMDWAVGFAQAAKSGDKASLIKLNAWLSDWVTNNPTYLGVNWKCGQEASIRVMHICLTALLLEQSKNSSTALLTFIDAHLKRIAPTIMYAIAQDNNHGTSEAAALYIGGNLLHCNGYKDGHKYHQLGCKWLENRAKRLIEEDGSFSQYSVTYHRVMLDTYSLVEIWRKAHGLTPFSNHLYSKLSLATLWLYQFTDALSGDAPNLGANDGARLIPLTDTDYRDFRPSVQLASNLFCKAKAFQNNADANLPVEWLGLTKVDGLLPAKVSRHFSYGGYLFLIAGDANAVLNYPKFRFRPSQCDALHLDFWLAGQNILRDGGTFSYNAGKEYIDYYGGVGSHNTSQFDSHQQMPRLSRFLLGDWLKSHSVWFDSIANTATAGYTDRFGCTHKRSLSLAQNKLEVVDDLTGFKEQAIIRFRLINSDWYLDGNTLTSSICSISVTSSDGTVIHMKLTSGKESRYYFQEEELMVLELTVSEPTAIITEVTF
ncbi:heparinase II/III-family protein [Vibrio cyclitrophicus]